MKQYAQNTLATSFNPNQKSNPYKEFSTNTLRTEPTYNNQERLKSDIIFSKVLSKEKHRGILDMSSPGNKDVFTDSDSELSQGQKNKIKENNKKNMDNKKGCAKLIIEKVESQVPKKTDYKLVNRKKNNYGNKYNNKLIRFNSPPNEVDINFSNNSSIKYDNISNNINKSNIFQKRGFTNEKVYNKYKPNRIDKGFKSINNNLNSNNKKLNYSQNKINNVDTNKNNIYKYGNERIYDKYKYNSNKYGNLSTGKTNINSQLNKSSYIYKSTENSVDKSVSSSLNFGRYKESRIKNDSNPSFTYYTNNSFNKSSIALKKNYPPNTQVKKTISLYNDFKDIEKKRPTISQLINLSYNTQSNKTYLQNKFNEKLLKSVIKIQSFWRGAFIRDLLLFYKRLSTFINSIINAFNNKKRQNFYYFLNLVKDLEKPKNKRISIGANVKGPSVRQKYILSKEKNNKITHLINNRENIDNESTPKKEDNNYNKLLNDYNSLMDKYNKLKKQIDEINNKKNVFDKLDIDNNNLEIINNEKKKTQKNLSRKYKLNRNNNDNNNKTEETKKKFDIIKPEQKEEFNIIPKSNNKNIKLRGRYLNNKKPISKIEKVFEIKILNDKEKEEVKINYEDYLNHFNLNMKKENNEEFIIEQNPNKKILNEKIPFYISNNCLTLINKRKKSKEQEKPKMFDNMSINKNDNCEMTIINEKVKEEEEEKPKVFDNISINKNENCELTIFNEKIKEEEKEKPKVFDNISINKDESSELTIIDKKIKEEEKEEIKEEKKELKRKETKSKKKKKGKKHELKEENQNNNLDNEKKEPDNNKIKVFKDCIVNEHNTNINIISIKKQKEFDKDKISLNQDISLNFIGQQKSINDLNNENNNEEKEKKENEVIDKVNEEDKSREEKKFDGVLMIDNNNALYIKKEKKNKNNEITEITEELNVIEPNNHYELLLSGITLNKDLENTEFIKNNYNNENEIQQENEIELNPTEIVENKNSIFKEKAKEKIMKIILPIRLKNILREYIRKKIYYLLIKRIKKKK